MTMPRGNGLGVFRVWAPDATHVDVRLGDQRHALDPEPDGSFAAALPAGDGSPYSFVVDDASWSLSGWTRYPFGDAFGGSYLASSSSGSWFSYSERARDIGLLAVKFSGAGRPAGLGDVLPTGCGLVGPVTCTRSYRISPSSAPTSCW